MYSIPISYTLDITKQKNDIRNVRMPFFFIYLIRLNALS